MRTTARHQLKQDRFAETAAETYSWAVEHRTKLIYAGVVVAVVLVVVLGGWAYYTHQNAHASDALGEAMATYDAPIRPANMPEQPGMLTFASLQERAQASYSKFEKIANDYPRTASGKVARYFAGITAKQMNDDVLAEKNLKEVANSGSSDLASLAKLALAGLYRDTKKDQQAIDLYKQLIDHPTEVVAKTTAQLQLAEMYQPTQPQEAAKIYEQIRKEAPQSAAAQLAAQSMGSLQSK